MRILGVSPAHDASVCVLNDGQLEFFCKEERVIRKKRKKLVFPYDRNHTYVNENYQIGEKNLNCSLNLYKDLFDDRNYSQLDQAVFSSPSWGIPGELTYEQMLHKFLKNHLNLQAKSTLKFSHHLCHAYLAFVNSKFSQSLVFVIDRNGSVIIKNNTILARESESVFLFDENGHKELYLGFWKNANHNKCHIRKVIQDQYPNSDVTINLENEYSIVKVYEAATTLIGEDPLENGKTMGLSSYGQNIFYHDLFIEQNPIENYFDHTLHPVNEKYNAEIKGVVCFNNLENKFINIKDLNESNFQFYANRAKHVQLETQKAALRLIEKYVKLTGIKNVCIVGGYALNVVANNFYIRNLPEVNFYFEPTADDTGTSIGGTMLAHKQITGEYPKPLEDNFYHYYDDNEALATGVDSNIEEICDLLMKQKSVAIFEGSPEAGPRALGHRSILFDPRNINAKEIVNKIKKREWFRPFAGTILESEFSNYFHTYSLKESPYMTINFEAKEITKTLVPGIVHVDDTCRIQTVNKGFLYELLYLFYRKTGCPMLLNTSFNLAGLPLVQTKQDAIEVFDNSVLDCVYFVDDKKIIKK